MKVCCCDAVGVELYVDSNLLWNEKTCTFLVLNLLKEGDEQLLFYFHWQVMSYDVLLTRFCQGFVVLFCSLSSTQVLHIHKVSEE